MKKLIAAVLALIVIGVCVALVMLYLQLGRIVKRGIETVGPRVTQSTVTVGDIDFRPLKGSLRIEKLVVGNPEGFKSESAFSVGEVRIALTPKSLFSDSVDIAEIVIDQPQVTYEVGIGKTNIGALQRNVEAFLETIPGAGDADEPSEPEPDTAEPGKKVSIGHALVQNGSVRVTGTMLQGPGATLDLPKLDIRDIGKEEPVTPVEAGVQILNRVLYAVIDIVTSNSDVLKDAVQDARGTLEQTRDKLKKDPAAVLEGVKGLLNRGDSDD